MANDDFNPGGDDWAAAIPNDGFGGSGDGAIEANGFDDFDTDGIDPDDIGRGGFIDLPGKYHLEWSDAKRRDAKETYNGERGDIQVTGTCLLTVKGQSPERSTLTHWIELPTASDRQVFTTADGKAFKDGKSLFDILMSGLVNFFLSAGVLEKRKVKDQQGQEVLKVVDPETGTTKLNVATFPSRLIGRQSIGNVEKEEYTDKNGQKKTKIRLHRYRPITSFYSPESEGVPANEEALKVAGIVRYVTKANTATPAAPAGNGGKRGARQSATAATPPATNVQAQQTAPSGELDI